MHTLVIGLIIFIAIHLIPLNTDLRQRCISRLGEGAYKGLFSLVSLFGFYLIVTGKSHASVITLWTPPAWSAWLTIVMMFFAIALVAAAYIPSDIKRVTAHPMLWGVLTWSVAHLISNGDAASIVLFAGFALFSIVSIIAAPTKTKATEKAELAHKTSFNWTKNLTLVALSAAIYATVIVFHINLFGKAVFVST